MLFSANPYSSRWIVSLIVRSCGRLSRCRDEATRGIWHKIGDRRRARSTFQFGETCCFESDSGSDRSRPHRRYPPREVSVVHVGDGLRSSCLIRQVKPVYPSQAKAANIVGNVILEVRTDRNGYVEDVTVVLGHPSLIQSAIDAVRQWRYVPVVLRGEAVPVVTTVVVPFGSK